MGSQATDITLERHKLVLPGAAKITFIVLMGGLKEMFPRGSWFA